MATVVVTTTALAELEALQRSHNLPADTKDRFRRSIRHLNAFPEHGSRLVGRWKGYRFVLGPWRWMLVVYRYEAANDDVVIVTVQDSRSRRARPSSDNAGGDTKRACVEALLRSVQSTAGETWGESASSTWPDRPLSWEPWNRTSQEAEAGCLTQPYLHRWPTRRLHLGRLRGAGGAQRRRVRRVLVHRLAPGVWSAGHQPPRREGSAAAA